MLAAEVHRPKPVGVAEPAANVMLSIGRLVAWSTSAPKNFQVSRAMASRLARCAELSPLYGLTGSRRAGRTGTSSAHHAHAHRQSGLCSPASLSAPLFAA